MGRRRRGGDDVTGDGPSVRAYVVPRWAGRPTDDWYPWLRSHFADDPRIEGFEILDMPSPEVPTLEGWGAHLREHLPGDPDAASRTILVGHSVGCRALLRFLAEVEAGTVFRRVVLVAGWWTVDAPWDTLLPWIQASFDLAAARRAAPSIDVLVSDDDPFTADHETTRRTFESRLGARVTLAPGRKHFNAAEEPDVLRVIDAALQAP